jgi:glutamate-5-semialdehyde dehydrogenase
MADPGDLTNLPAGTPVLVGTRVLPLPALRPGDRVLAVGRVESLVVISAAAHAAAVDAVRDAEAAFVALGSCGADQVDAFFLGFAARLADASVWAAVSAANQEDVQSAESRGRGTSRLRVSEKMRAAMIDGLRGWAKTPSRVGAVLERRRGDDFVIERRAAPLGVVVFVFEGRPNVFADGAGVVRNGNAAVMRIGGDALGTALAIEEHALHPALREAGLPLGAVRLLRSKDHAAGQALFTLPSVRLAVARGSGSTVAGGGGRPPPPRDPPARASPRRFTAQVGPGSTSSRARRPKRWRTCCAIASTAKCATRSTCWSSTALRWRRSGRSALASFARSGRACTSRQAPRAWWTARA